MPHAASSCDASRAPAFDPTAPLLFVVNAAAGHGEGEQVRGLIEPLLASAGRAAQWWMSGPGELPGHAQAGAARARQSGGAVVAVGGDGTINTVAQAAHAAGCAMGVVPQGTFNYFARSNGIPFDPEEAGAFLLVAEPAAVQVAAVNERLFLVNASLGLYPELLEDREAYKARWGRSRLVALGAGCLTLLRAQRLLRLEIELHGEVREVRALTLFVGNNRLQLQMLGVEAPAPPGATTGEGRITAVMLKPVHTLAMLRLMLRGAMGTLGEADDVERFAFTRMRVRSSVWAGRRSVKVAYDGEVERLRPPLDFRVHPRPLYLLKAPGGGAAEEPA